MNYIWFSAWRQLLAVDAFNQLFFDVKESVILNLIENLPIISDLRYALTTVDWRPKLKL